MATPIPEEWKHTMKPHENWKRITIDSSVHIPTADGKEIAETIEVMVDAWQDESGEIYLDTAALKKLDDSKARHMGLLLPEDIRHLRESLGVTQVEISQLLKIGEKTWSRWENGRGRPSQSMNVLLKILLDGKADINYLRFMDKPQDRLKVSKHLLSRTGRVQPMTYAVLESSTELQPEYS